MYLLIYVNVIRREHRVALCKCMRSGYLNKKRVEFNKHFHRAATVETYFYIDKLGKEERKRYELEFNLSVLHSIPYIAPQQHSCFLRDNP